MAVIRNATLIILIATLLGACSSSATTESDDSNLSIIVLIEDNSDQGSIPADSSVARRVNDAITAQLNQAGGYTVYDRTVLPGHGSTRPRINTRRELLDMARNATSPGTNHRIPIDVVFTASIEVNHLRDLGFAEVIGVRVTGYVDNANSGESLDNYELGSDELGSIHVPNDCASGCRREIVGGYARDIAQQVGYELARVLSGVRRPGHITLAELTSGRSILQVTTNEPGVTVLLDGIKLGRTPLSREDLRPGSYTLSLQSPYHVDLEVPVPVTLADDVVFKEDYVLQAGTGHLTVLSEPPGANVYIDGHDTGEVTPVTLNDVTAGTRTLSLRLAGYQTTEPQTEVTVEKKQTTRVNETLWRALQLTVNATPSNAIIRLISQSNIISPVRAAPGTLSWNLRPGRYELEVSATHHVTQTKQVVLLFRDKDISITLQPEQRRRYDYDKRTIIIPGSIRQ